MREKKDEWCDGREKKLNFGNEITEIHVLPSSCPWSEVPKMHARGSTRKGKQLCGNQVAEIVRNGWKRHYKYIIRETKL